MQPSQTNSSSNASTSRHQSHQSRPTRPAQQGPNRRPPLRWARHLGIPFFITPLSPAPQPAMSTRQPPSTSTRQAIPLQQHASSLQHSQIQQRVDSSQQAPPVQQQQQPASQRDPSNHQQAHNSQIPPVIQQQQPPAFMSPSYIGPFTPEFVAYMATTYRAPKLTTTPLRTINLRDVDWGQITDRCPYIHPVTGVRCSTQETRPTEWRLTRHASTHLFEEVKLMKEGELGFCQGAIITSLETYNRYHNCWFFCDKCLIVRSQLARTSGILISLDVGEFMCDSCESQYFQALRHFYKPRFDNRVFQW